MKSRHGVASLLAATVLVTSCMTSNVMMIPEPTDDAQLIGAGVLLVQVADTTPFGAAYPVNQITLAPKDVNESDQSQFPRLDSVDTKGDSTSFFYAILPANEYSISSLRSYHSFGDRYFSQFYPGGIELGTFSIESGKVTDLGILATYIDRSGDDYRFHTVRTAGEARTTDIMSSKLPGLSGRLQNRDEPLDWHADGRDSERQNDYLSAVDRQTVFGNPFLDTTTGAAIFPSRLGVIVNRSGAGDWEVEAFPEDCELRFLTRIGADMVVVTEFDEIYARQSPAEEWREVDAPPGAGKLMLLGMHDSVGVYAVTQDDRSVSVWTAGDLASSWSRASSIEPKLNFFEKLDQSLLGIEQNISGAQYIADGGYIYLALRNDLYRYNLSSAVFEELPAPNAQSVQIRNGYISVDTYGTGDKISFDSGASWRRYTNEFYGLRTEKSEAKAQKELGETFNYKSISVIGHPIFLDENRGLAIHKSKGKDGEPFLIETDSGAATWFTASETPLPEGCYRLVLASDDEILLGCPLSGEFYRSTDFGATWELDREVSES